MTITEELRPGPVLYAVCKTCGLQLETPERAQAHRTETFDAAKASGAEPRSHTTRTLNPTLEQRQRGIIDRHIEWAYDHLCEDLHNDVVAGRLTRQAVEEALQIHPDVADFWRQWWASEHEEGECDDGERG